MAKPNIPNQKKAYQALNNRLNRYVAMVEKVYESLNHEAALLVSSTNYSAESGVFKFADYPQTRKRLQDIQAQFVNDINAIIYRGTSDEWHKSNEIQDLLANKVLKTYEGQIDKQKYKMYYEVNSDALKAFQTRKDKGFNVSNKLWEQSKVYKEELESAISCAIQKGTSAVTLSKQISKYLIDFPSLQKDYKEIYGEAKHIKDCEYRSIRLARTEINMAYRSAENERWRQMDFVVGYEIKRSGRNFPCKVCEALAGKYPKDFDWNGWHPSCRCYKIPILKTEEEFWSYDGKSEPTTESVNEVKDIPDNFKKWCSDNKQRIDYAKENGTLPYFLKDNKEYLESNDIKSVQFKKVDFVPDKLRSMEDFVTSDRQIEVLTQGEFKSLNDFFINGLKIAPEEAQKYIERVLDESAPYMAIDSSTFMNKVVKGDGMFKSSIETGKGTFKTIGEERAVKERAMFGLSEDISPEDYPKYGFLSDASGMNNQDIVTWGYGDIYIKFKKGNVFPRSTYTVGDSYDGNRISNAGKVKANCKSYLSYSDESSKGYKEYSDMLKIWSKFSDEENVFTHAAPCFPCNQPNSASLLSLNQNQAKILKENISAGIDKLADLKGSYVECQIYGKLSVSDIESIEVSKISTKVKLEKLFKKQGLDINIVESKYSYDLEMFKVGITDYDKKFSKYVVSLSDKDVDNLGDVYIDKLMGRVCDMKNGFWKTLKVPDDISILQTKISSSLATTQEKRLYLKWYENEMAKKGSGIFPKVWWDDYSPKISGWTEDVLNKDLLKQ